MSGSQLAAFLERHPWPTQMIGAAEPIDFLWRFEIDAPLDVMWCASTPTSALGGDIAVLRWTVE